MSGRGFKLRPISEIKLYRKHFLPKHFAMVVHYVNKFCLLNFSPLVWVLSFRSKINPVFSE